MVTTLRSSLWPRWKKTPKARGGRRHARRNTLLRSQLLERREVLTTTLYLDFGDRFVNNSLTVLEDDFDNANINGPDLAGGNQETLTFTSFGNAVNIDFNGDGQTNATDDTALRSAIISLVQRAYEVFDVTVVNLTANFQTVNGNQVRAASSIADIDTTLHINDAAAEHNDAYVMVTGFSGSAGVSQGFFGVAGGNDILTTNLADDTAIVDVDQIVAGLTGTVPIAAMDKAMAHTTSHEAAHTFGLEHTANFNPPDTDLLGRSDTIRSGPSFDASFRQYASFFTRYTLDTFNGTQNSYDELANDPVIGLKANAPAFVTGTGAFDVISITRVNATTASVSVQPHRDATFNNPIGNAVVYNVTYTNGIIVEAGMGADRVTITGGLGVNVRVRGGEGNDNIDASAMSSGNVTLYGDEGNDTLIGSMGADSLYGGIGDDHAYGGYGNDNLFGEDGNDQLWGQDGADNAYGGNGNDGLYGGADNDNLFGEAGNDIINGSTGNDSLNGGAGNDTYYFDGAVNLGADTLNEAASVDTDTINLGVFGAAARLNLWQTTSQIVAAGLLTLTLNDATGIENVEGSAFNDVIEGNSRNNVLKGNNGDDYLLGYDGADDLNGGNGNDHAYGGNGNDIVRGGAGADDIFGQDGDDTLYAQNDAADSLNADGADILHGGLGVDAFFYRVGEDTVFDP